MNHLKSRALVWLLGLALFSLSGCGGGGAAAPTTKPTVQIVAPAYGASVTEGELVNVQAVAADVGGITRAELYVDGQLANTKLAQNPQGEQQFNASLEWVASKLGAHTLVVRAFNTAGGAGEASLPLAVNPPLGVTTSVAIADTRTPITPNGANPTDAVATDVPPDGGLATATLPPVPFHSPDATLPAETEAPPTAALPTATLPPLPFHGPGDGGTNVSLIWTDDGLYIEANANDSRVGGDNGDGIAYVEIVIQDLEGKVIANKRLTTAPYCYFGVEDGNCVTVQQGTDQFVWRSGVPIQPGWYFVRAVSHTPDELIQVAERPLRLNEPPDSFEDVFVDIFVEQQTEDVQRELSFEAEVSGAGTDSGIDRVELSVVLYDGQIVHARTERTPRYCAFSGGDNGAPCPSFEFADNDFKWSSGAPIYPTEYVLRAVVYLNDGTIAATATMIKITRVQ